MTIQELSKYHDLKTEIKQLEENIKELEMTVSSPKITGMPISKNGSSNNPTERIGLKLVQLRNKLIFKREELLDEISKIEDFLTSIDDAEIRIIIRKRFLEGKTWNIVSNEINADRSTPYYRLKKYLKERSSNNEKVKEKN